MGDQGLSGRPRGGDGWAERGMRWLGTATQVVEISFAWWIGTLLGLVVLGWLPSSVAATSVLSRLGTDDASATPLGDFTRVWRQSFVRGNAVGWPATVALPILAVNAWILTQGGQSWMPLLLAGNGLLAVWLVLAVAFLVVLVADERSRGVSMTRLWRAALGLPVASVPVALAWLVTAAALASVAWRFPILVPLAVPGLLALLTAWLMRRRLDQTEVLGESDEVVVDSRATTE